MRNRNGLLVGIMILGGISCTPLQPVEPLIEAHQPFAVTASEKRINTMVCHDKDDWYLDGYRVGKSFRTYQQKLLKQRTVYCEKQTKQPISAGLLKAWQKGYQQGIK